MRMWIAVVATVLVALGVAGCGPSAPSEIAVETETSELAGLTRAALVSAQEASAGYGQAHLGHYLDMRAKDLRREGLQLPDGLSLRVSSRHMSYCIVATNEALPSIHPWAVGTVSSGNRTPSSEDRCHR